MGSGEPVTGSLLPIYFIENLYLLLEPTIFVVNRIDMNLGFKGVLTVNNPFQRPTR